METADRPPDGEILAHEQDVRTAAAAVPLVGEQVSLDGLKAQYASNPGFLPKVEGLSQRFSATRQTRPDGNCFYRAYLFGIFEQLVGQPTRLSAFSDRAQGSLEWCEGAGYERVAIELFYEEFLACLEKLGSAGASVRTVEEMLPEYDDYLVCWARCLTSASLKRRADEFSAFLSSHSSMAEFCAQEVDPMAKDADHLQITALSSYLGVPVTVVYLDRSEGNAAAEHTFQEVGSTAAATSFPPVYLLYRPGHYDLIYPL